jgi:dTDP-4-amino-4,6-dideoxygalactose transaminase
MPIYHQESYKDSAPREFLPLTERHCRSVVSLPIFPFITDEEIEYTCAIIKKFFERG